MPELDPLKLENQICFPLYACSKEIISRYKEFLDAIDLTYTQYITMMVLWDKKEVNVSELGKQLYLDSGTLTPLLKKLEAKGYVIRTRSKDDERNLLVSLSNEGMELRNKALSIPGNIMNCVSLDEKEAVTLYKLLYKVLNSLK